MSKTDVTRNRQSRHKPLVIYRDDGEPVPLTDLMDVIIHIETGLSYQEIRENVKWMQDHGHLEVINEAKTGLGLPCYHLTPEGMDCARAMGVEIGSANKRHNKTLV